MSVRVRFAPSPTGYLHIGSVRTALYNYLFARNNNGKLLLRIEDTDRERYMEGAVKDITDTLKWLKLDYDEGPDAGGWFGPYIQSQRLEYYQKHAQQLIEKGLAYTEEGAIRFQTPKSGKTSWRELIGDKEVIFNNSTQEDFIILKSDGFPTYNFANVVDDHYMEITHVIRGPEFISSTPKHLMLYQAFGWQPPQFGHAPMILGTDRSKLSKRHGAKAASDFRKDGYLPEVILNFMALLGWTPPSGREILTFEEMLKEFDIKSVRSSGAIFDIQKLEWMNGEYIRKMSDGQLSQRLQEYLVDHPAREKIASVVPLIKERIKKLSDFIPLTNFIWEQPEYDRSVFEKAVKNRETDIPRVLSSIRDTMTNLPRPWQAKEFEAAFRKLAEDHQLPAGEIFQLIRVSVSGQLVTPPLFETIKLIGEQETLQRVNEVIDNYLHE